ncbi:SsrA-binding protein SmpB [Enterobacteriaceae endosymbiont of Macroplea appendiculata]|uniref:SsrA-binding protein SmpB n=1 Tax=Enterobacteriaceae endosymbiont of Macroplea appendiculata TaxID=2675790 RepID=UPI001448BD7C|nr:SsrA-binding protein SmpB [Enterobacteriaceae endosymbiont of Macroplea appendiculata]QJC30982.1 SsrA-binding protein SmpB [Enterobacteriaceae endosymbiont of Macroplea appendiculata]
MNKKKIIILNKKIYHNFFIQKNIETGIILQGWEVKSLRACQITINNSYVNIINNKIYLINTYITPLITSCNHNQYTINRKRELLLHTKEIELIKNYINKQHLTVVLISLYWYRSFCKTNIALAKGKNKIDKRNLLKYKEWNINKLRIQKKYIQ